MHAIARRHESASRLGPVLLLAAFVAAGSCVPAVGWAGDDLAGMLASHPLRTLDGEKAELGRLEGSVVVLNFWASWCKPCRKELPVLDEWFREYAGRGVKFVPISIGSEARKAQRMARKLELEMPLYHDGPDGLAARIDLPHLPITYVIDPRGETIAVANGSKASELARIRAAIEGALPKAGTASMGSSAGGQR